MSINTFNDGDTLKSIRENSLNPAIEQVNVLTTQVAGVTTDISGVKTAQSALETRQSSLEASMQVTNSNVAQKISGIHLEDKAGNQFDDIKSIKVTGGTVALDADGVSADLKFNNNIELCNGQSPDSTTIKVECIEFPNATLTTRDNGRIGIVGLPTSGGGTGIDGIILDNGTASIGSITKIEVPTCELVSKGAGLVEMTPHIQFNNEDNTQHLLHQVDLVKPLKASHNSNDGIGALYIEPNYFEPAGVPAHLAYLSEGINVVGKYGQRENHGKLWFDDVIASNEMLIQPDMASKTITVQAIDIDPNVDGGTDCLLCYRIHMKGTAPANGYVKIYVMEEPFIGQPKLLTDANGNPVVVERLYKTDDELGVLDIITVINVKANVRMGFYVADSFVGEYITITDRVEGCSGVMIQAMTSERKTSEALLQFESDTKQNIEFNSYYLGPKRMDIDWLAHQPIPYAVGPAGIGETLSDGVHFYNISAMGFGVENDYLKFKDDGTHESDFNFGKIFSAEETGMLQGKAMLVETTLNSLADHKVVMLKWTGKADEYSKEIFKSRDGSSLPVYEQGWTEVEALTCTGGDQDQDYSATFTVPVDAVNYAIIIYPMAPVHPYELHLKKFDVGVEIPFNGHSIRAPELLNEVHLMNSKQYLELVQDNQGYRALRYTINSHDTPMPVGVKKSGKADITLDPSKNAVAGSMARGGEGALEFQTDGKATLLTTLQLFNEQATDNTVTVWYSKVAQDGTKTIITESETTIPVKAGSKGLIATMNSFSLDVVAGDMIILTAKADKDDGAFLQANAGGRPLLRTMVNFDEIAGGAGDTGDLINAPLTKYLNVDRRSYEFSSNEASSVVIPVDIPADVKLIRHSVVSKNADRFTSVDGTRFRYDDTKNTITISGLLDVIDATIFLEFWG